jgi:hypothetical protein
MFCIGAVIPLIPFLFARDGTGRHDHVGFPDCARSPRRWRSHGPSHGKVGVALISAAVHDWHERRAGDLRRRPGGWRGRHQLSSTVLRFLQGGSVGDTRDRRGRLVRSRSVLRCALSRRATGHALNLPSTDFCRGLGECHDGVDAQPPPGPDPVTSGDGPSAGRTLVPPDMGLPPLVGSALEMQVRCASRAGGSGPRRPREVGAVSAVAVTWIVVAAACIGLCIYGISRAVRRSKEREMQESSAETH